MCIILTAYPGDLLEHLASFLALVRHLRRESRGAFESAARELHVDRSVLRRRMQTLAEWVGSPLLRGRGAGLQPTAAGLRLAERAERIRAEIRDLASDVATERVPVVVACTGTITTELLPRVLVELEALPRGPRLIVRRAGGQLCERLVRDGDVDLGVVRAGAPPARLFSEHLADDRLFVALPAAHPLASGPGRLRLADLAQIPLVLYGPSSRTRDRVMQRLEPLGASIRVEVDGKATALEYVRQGFGATFVSILPGHVVSVPAVVVRDVTSLFLRSGFYVIARRDRAEEAGMSQVIRRLVRLARQRR
jgi:DNA-binding transcriptional LysR family regulator